METIKNIFTRRVIIGGIIFAVILCVLMLIIQMGVLPYLETASNQKAKVALTPYIYETAAVTTIFPTVTVKPESLPGVVALGMTVQVAGTEQNGLRMRSEPGTDKTVVFLANEGEVFTIVDGPVIKDSLIWWQIQGLDDGQKNGWSVQDYLAAVQ